MVEGFAVYNKRTGQRMLPIFPDIVTAQEKRQLYAVRKIYWDDPNAPIVHTIVRRVMPVGRGRIHD